MFGMMGKPEIATTVEAAVSVAFELSKQLKLYKATKEERYVERAFVAFQNLQAVMGDEKAATGKLLDMAVAHYGVDEAAEIGKKFNKLSAENNKLADDLKLDAVWAGFVEALQGGEDDDQ